jgi:hypothetical protein
LAFDELELGDLAFGLAVGPGFDDGVVNGVAIVPDPARERGQETGSGILDIPFLTNTRCDYSGAALSQTLKRGDEQA